MATGDWVLRPECEKMMKEWDAPELPMLDFDQPGMREVLEEGFVDDGSGSFNCVKGSLREALLTGNSSILESAAKRKNAAKKKGKKKKKKKRKREKPARAPPPPPPPPPPPTNPSMTIGSLRKFLEKIPRSDDKVVLVRSRDDGDTMFEPIAVRARFMWKKKDEEWSEPYLMAYEKDDEFKEKVMVLDDAD